MSKISKEELDSIVELSENIPEKYQQICFEQLLRFSLGRQYIKPTSGEKNNEGNLDEELPLLPSKEFKVPIDVKAFLNQYGMTEEILWKLFITEGVEIRPIYALKDTQKSKVQIQYALLLSLENALINGKFETEIEVVRTRCKNEKTYDGVNFSTNFKNNEKLFKSIDKDNPLALTPDGKTELADLIESIIQ